MSAFEPTFGLPTANPIALATGVMWNSWELDLEGSFWDQETTVFGTHIFSATSFLTNIWLRKTFVVIPALRWVTLSPGVAAGWMDSKVTMLEHTRPPEDQTSILNIFGFVPAVGIRAEARLGDLVVSGDEVYESRWAFGIGVEYRYHFKGSVHADPINGGDGYFPGGAEMDFTGSSVMITGRVLWGLRKKKAGSDDD